MGNKDELEKRVNNKNYTLGVPTTYTLGVIDL